MLGVLRGEKDRGVGSVYEQETVYTCMKLSENK